MKWYTYNVYDFVDCAKSWHLILFERLEFSYMKLGSFKEGKFSFGYSCDGLL